MRIVIHYRYLDRILLLQGSYNVICNSDYYTYKEDRLVLDHLILYRLLRIRNVLDHSRIIIKWSVSCYLGD